MRLKLLCDWALIFALGLMMVGFAPNPVMALSPLRRINAPYFDGEVQFDQTGVFWLGRVTPTDNYADVRIGYNQTELYVHVAIFDRRLWYDEAASPATLTNWDSVSLYLSKTGDPASGLDANAYRFDGQVNWWEARPTWQAVYRGTNNTWTPASVPFTTTTGFKWESATEGGFNNDQNNRGWVITYHIPFSSLGLSNPPSIGSLWRLAIAVHDRDSATGPLNPDQIWPENASPNSPATWGQLHYGLPVYSSPAAIARGSALVRHKLNGANVVDGEVGGDTNCGNDLTDRFSQWGEQNFAGIERFNVQNQADISDWPCYSKYYVTFPLDTVPAGKAIISATLTLHQFGNAGQGWTPGPEPSFIQVFTVDQLWDEATLTWNNAPLARENLGGTWVDPLDVYPGYPGIPHSWEVSRAVAEAYAAGAPLRLAVYSADWAYHSGRYFYSSDTEDLNAVGRPSLSVIWGEPAATLQAQVVPIAAHVSQPVTYTYSMLSGGYPLTLTTALPLQVSAPGAITAAGGGSASYDSGVHRITWTGSLPFGQSITLTVPVTVILPGPMAVMTIAILTDSIGNTSTASTMFIIDALRIRLPLLRRN